MGYGRVMVWEIKYSHEAEAWVDGLLDDEWNAMMAAVDLLEEHGPSLRRPTVGNIVSSRHKNMKELISFGGNLRALFAFDPLREAIILLGGDKSDDWDGWYTENVPLADELYDDYLTYLRSEGRIP